MNLENMKKEELELLSYPDLTEMILKQDGGSLNTPTIFRKICDMLEYSDDDYQSKIGDFYTSLTTDKRFILLENAQWDLRDRHKVEIIMDMEDDDELEEEEEIEEDDTNLESEEENIDDDILDDDVLDLDDDLDDLSIIDDEKMGEE